MQVIWLDVIAARARYGRWIGGCLPSFVPVPLAGKATAKARKGGAPGEGQLLSLRETEEMLAVRLKQLKCESSLGLPCIVAVMSSELHVVYVVSSDTCNNGLCHLTCVFAIQTYLVQEQPHMKDSATGSR